MLKLINGKKSSIMNSGNSILKIKRVSENLTARKYYQIRIKIEKLFNFDCLFACNLLLM